MAGRKCILKMRFSRLLDIRLTRMVASLVAIQAKLPILNFDMLKGKKKQEYFGAVQQGLNRDYAPMEKIFDEIIDSTLRLSGG